MTPNDEIRIFMERRLRQRVYMELQRLQEPDVLHFQTDMVRVDAIPVPEEKWFSFTMRRAGMPSFATVPKRYYGTEALINAYLRKRGNLQPVLYPCDTVCADRVIFPKTAWSHRTPWDYDFRLEADSISMDRVILHNGIAHCLCIRPVFRNLRYYKVSTDTWMPMPDRFWGQPHVMEKDGDDFVTNLFLRYESFPALCDAEACFRDPANIRFDAVCNEIFGDG